MADDSIDVDYSTEHSELFEEYEEYISLNFVADPVMGTYSSPEIEGSRKRPLDGTVDNRVTKKPHYAGGAYGTYHMKLLVPNVAAGAIIGDRGETIEQLEIDTEARVKMSKANDFYPGTSERICLITGYATAIMEVLSFVMKKMEDLAYLSTKQTAVISADRHKQVKILVPDTTAGKIIGKAGTYINHIEEESGCSIKISPKSQDQTLQERCITVTGDMKSNKRACRMILDKIVEDPKSGTCLNVSYADASGPVAHHRRQQTHMRAPFKNELEPLGAHGTYHLKLLVPNGACGAIIGKGGDTIEQLQKVAEARVKMSKANDFYPGTSERICLITGNVHAVMEVLTFIMKKMRDLPDLNAKQTADFDNKTSADRHKQVKILVPHTTAGRIIGKAGSYIKQIEEKSGSCVKMSLKSKGQTLKERCITVTGDINGNKTACRMILEKVVEDPESGKCLNVSYADVSGPVANHSRPQAQMHIPFNNAFVPSGAYGTYHLKLLVPNVAARAIIGKGGETIEQLQKNAEARVQMSEPNDFYPGTSERICLITGDVYAIMAVFTFIMAKIRNSPDLKAKQTADSNNKTATDRHKQIKILVPDTTAGKIIGRAGSCIKQIEEESGSCVKISPKSQDQTLQERCITVSGDMESNRRACRMILDKVVDDPEGGTCLNVSYADVSGPVANYNSTDSP